MNKCKLCGADLDVPEGQLPHFDWCPTVRGEWEKMWRETDKRFRNAMRKLRGEDETEER